MSDRSWKPGEPPPPGYLVSRKGTLYKAPNPPRGLDAIKSAAPTVKRIAEYMDVSTKFGKRGLTERTIRALADCSIDYPERLLFMTEQQLRSIPGIGKASMAEIVAYRNKFIR